MGVVGGWFQLCILRFLRSPATFYDIANSIFHRGHSTFAAHPPLTFLARESKPKPLYIIIFVVLLLLLKMFILSLDASALLDSIKKVAVPRDKKP